MGLQRLPIHADPELIELLDGIRLLKEFDGGIVLLRSSLALLDWSDRPRLSRIVCDVRGVQGRAELSAGPHETKAERHG